MFDIFRREMCLLMNIITCIRNLFCTYFAQTFLGKYKFVTIKNICWFRFDQIFDQFYTAKRLVSFNASCLNGFYNFRQWIFDYMSKRALLNLSSIQKTIGGPRRKTKSGEFQLTFTACCKVIIPLKLHVRSIEYRLCFEK